MTDILTTPKYIYTLECKKYFKLYLLLLRFIVFFAVKRFKLLQMTAQYLFDNCWILKSYGKLTDKKVTEKKVTES